MPNWKCFRRELTNLSLPPAVRRVFSPEELGTVMRSLGQEITHENLDLIFASVDNDKSGCICFDEFLVLMSRFMPPEGNTEDELMAAFQYFDKGKTGTFGLDEIEQAIHQLGMDITPAQMKNMLSCADTDHDGHIDLCEWEACIEIALQNKLEQRAAAREAQAKAAQKEIAEFTGEFLSAARQCFQLIDKDCGGSLSKTEIVEAVRGPRSP